VVGKIKMKCPLEQDGYCEKVKMNVTTGFCIKVCQGDWKIQKKILALEVKNNLKKIKRMKKEQKKGLGKIALTENFAYAINRVLKRGFKRVPEQIYIERKLCCTTCGNGKTCPYCGCKKNWKAWLKSEEACPRPDTYPNLPKYPPRNYWGVCGELVSVIIPSRNDPYLKRTVDSVKENAAGPLEILVELDNKGEGRRILINRAARRAKGKYLFILDAHCTMSYGWDTKLKCACGPLDIAFCQIQSLNGETFQPEPNHIYGHVYFDRNLNEKWWYREIKHTIEESMCFTGCGWMIQKDRFWSLGGYDEEELGKWGYDGPEWSLKVQLDPRHPGKILLRSDVTCGHVFGTNDEDKLYPVEMMPQQEYFDRMFGRWGDRIPMLVQRFWPVPSWEQPWIPVLEYSQTAFCGFEQIVETKST